LTEIKDNLNFVYFKAGKKIDCLKSNFILNQFRYNTRVKYHVESAMSAGLNN